MKLSLIVPCYNEQDMLPIFYKETTGVLSEMGCSYELLFVDDGSTDSTLEILKKLAEEDGHVLYLSFSRNFGKEAAMYAGFCNISGEYVAVMDADLQDPPCLLPQMLDILERGEYDSVATRRTTRDGEPAVRSWLSRCFYKFINKISDVEIEEGTRDFRMMRRDVVDAIVSIDEYNRFLKGIYGWLGFKTYWITYENVKRPAGKTSWSLWKLFKYAINGSLNYSQIPLSLASWFGILVTITAFAATIFIVVRRLIWGDPVTGWASTACIIMFIGGIQTFCIGILGQYVAKIYLETKHRPHYIIAERSPSQEKEDE